MVGGAAAGGAAAGGAAAPLETSPMVGTEAARPPEKRAGGESEELMELKKLLAEVRVG